jgi:hypothetical protein
MLSALDAFAPGRTSTDGDPDAVRVEHAGHPASGRGRFVAGGPSTLAEKTPVDALEFFLWRYADREVEMVHRIAGPVGSGEHGTLRVPVELNSSVGARVLENHPDAPAPAPRVSPAEDPEPEGTRVEPERPFETSYSEADDLETHGVRNRPTPILLSPEGRGAS